MSDVVIAGAGVAGAALACALARSGLSVALVDRCWKPPTLFVGELLQPGGLASLATLGLADCVEGIDAQPIKGFAAQNNGVAHELPYPQVRGRDCQLWGRAFHHGRFVQRLRAAACAEQQVETIEATVVEPLMEQGRVRGVRVRDKEGQEREIAGRLTVAADGRHSKLRARLNGATAHTLSVSVGVLLKDVQLPSPGYGNVFVAQPAPILGYQIGTNEVRLLVDAPGKLPATAALRQHLREHVAPQLPARLGASFAEAVGDPSLPKMPNYALVPRMPRLPAALILGDALNMRHPVTGGGMTVALNDVRCLVDLLADGLPKAEGELDRLLARFYRQRRELALTIDLMAGALYEVLRADSPGLERMRAAMFGYWAFGGVAAAGPMALLSGTAPRPAKLLAHYLAVASVGVGEALWPRGDLFGAYEVASAAYTTMRPRLREALRQFVSWQG